MFRLTLIVVFLFIAPIALHSFPIPLEKQWKISFGKNIEKEAQGIKWKDLPSLPIPNNFFEPQGASSEAYRVATLRKNIEFSPEEIQQLNVDSPSVHFPLLSNAYEIYFNGKRIAQRGSFDKKHILSNGSKRHVIAIIPRDLIQSGSNELRLVVAADPGQELSVLANLESSTPAIDLHSRNLNIVSERLDLMLLFLYLFVGIYHLLLFLKRSEESYNLQFAMFSIALSVYMYLRSNSIYDLNIDPLIQGKVEYIFVFNATLFFLLFLDTFFRGSIGKASRLYMIIVWSFSFLVAVSSGKYPNIILKTWHVVALVFAFYTVFIVGKAIRNKNPDALRLSIGFAILITTSIGDIIGAMKVIPYVENYSLARYGFLTFELGIMLILSNKFLRVHKQVEELNKDLDQKVKQRTAELQSTLSEVQELKVKQDGDYFLTSLLLDPLANQNYRNDSVTVEGYTRQKKQFEFRQWQKEIGGDIIMLDEIVLRKRRFVVVVNGDAMGKSMQGAGGALVLGVVFRSLVARTKTSGMYQSLSPELWLRECFNELQMIFESFDGSMLVSVVMGLVDIEAGLFYYLNAEHPWTILYRDGIASFIEDKLVLRKLGTTGLKSKMKVKVFYLEKGDALFIGSDGRDDIQTGTDAEGYRIINEDESQFLQRIQESKGELSEVVASLDRFGEMTDDLTIVKVSYLRDPVRLSKISSEDFPDENYMKYNKSRDWQTASEYLEAHQEGQKELPSPIFQKELARVYYKTRKYDSALSIFESLVQEFPEDIESMYFASKIHMKSKRYKQSIELSERISLREPGFLNNLLNLATCYIHLQKPILSKRILSRVEHLDPGNKYAKRILSMLEH
ncbi:histidine kinase [Leptospira perolatii]|uniref:Histidine kinase n=1 Tax=Leptospira perolatii TaxID=2023191 RepID=A0A2M9ZM50_9LEPT|nr:SpoIIE family protein phosphatase [Leptospira perolatii]PJZ69848.1 histidine kinase [Leptospira perolatii]PJZ73170.1 histidine kinase [Leptospira perolatii]